MIFSYSFLKKYSNILIWNLLISIYKICNYLRILLWKFKWLTLIKIIYFYKAFYTEYSSQYPVFSISSSKRKRSIYFKDIFFFISLNLIVWRIYLICKGSLLIFNYFKESSYLAFLDKSAWFLWFRDVGLLLSGLFL